MFRKALIATDLSPASDRVIEYAATLRALGCQELVLAHVIFVKHTVGLSEALQAEAAPQLAVQQERLAAMGFSVTTVMPVGVPGPELLTLAHAQECQFIVIGSHGHSLAREIALGGVATDVIHRADLPVLLVRMVIGEEAGISQCRVSAGAVCDHILYATDFSNTAERAFSYVESLVQHACHHVTVMHVQDCTRIAPQPEARLAEFNAVDRARLERLQRRLLDLGAEQVDVALPYGHPAQEVLAMAEREYVSLIVMGTHGRGFINDLFAGSVSHIVVRLSPVPVLLIPPIQ